KQTVKNKTDNKSSDFFNTTEERQKIEPLSFNRNPRDFKPQLETILFPDDYAFVYNKADILGGEEEEILVSLIHRRKAAVLDKNYRLLDYLADPVQINFTGHTMGNLLQPVPDLTGDGKSELVPAHGGSLYTTIISGEGQVLQKHLFSHGYDSYNCVIMGKDGIFHQRMQTGYLLYPRGILYYDTASQQYVGYNPSAVQSGYIYNEYYEGNFYYGAFTGSNGAEYTHTDGTLEKDTEYFFHTARDGGFSPERSQKYPESEDNRGKLFPFVLNLKTEGENTPVETLIFVTSRYREYYPGPFELFIHNFETGIRTVLFTGPVNGELISINTALYEGETVYALCFKHAGIWLVDNTLKLIKKINANSTFTLNKLIADFDGDGNSEFICIKEDRIVIISMSGEELVEIEVPEGVTPRLVTDVEQLEDGTIRITVSGKQGIYVYTM
ncbi:MAG: hypothetical protein KAR21_06370, partial [Spirochaetales bacterium]|nr:hypothetical protein [Spirochaetales bacterium]